MNARRRPQRPSSSSKPPRTEARRGEKSKTPGAESAAWTPRPGPPARPPDRKRLQKVLAAAGLGSRRQCEELIVTGRVEIDRSVVTELGTKVDPLTQQVRVDGVNLSRPERLYYAVHKPSGVVSTSSDPAGRPRVIDLIPNASQRLFAVGRLDMYSEGLILLTNDGELANQLTHPRYGVEKTYRVLVAGRPTPENLAELRKGVHLAEGLAKVDRIEVTKELKNSTILEMVLSEGRNREIRRVLARVDHKVLRLLRIAVGPIRLGNLPSGDYRPLTRDEIDALRNAAEMKRKGSHKVAKTPRKREAKK